MPNPNARRLLAERLAAISAKPLMAVALLAIVATALLANHMNGFDRALKRGRLEAGIVQMELAFTTERAVALARDWVGLRAAVPPQPGAMGWQCAGLNNGIECARASLRWDWLLIVLYASTLILVFAAGLRLRGIAPSERHLSWMRLPVLAGLADIVENVLMVALLTGALSAGAVSAMGAFAVVKFTLIAVYLVGMAYFLTRRSSQRQAL